MEQKFKKIYKFNKPVSNPNNQIQNLQLLKPTILQQFSLLKKNRGNRNIGYYNKNRFIETNKQFQKSRQFFQGFYNIKLVHYIKNRLLKPEKANKNKKSN